MADKINDYEIAIKRINDCKYQSNTSLDLSGLLIESLPPELQELVQLEELSIHNTLISNLNLLSTLINLKVLSAGETRISDLSPIKALTHLQKLYIYNTQISDLSLLSALTRLQFLSVPNTQVISLQPLSTLFNLQQLYMGGTQVDDLNPLGVLTKLQVLNISNTQVRDLSPLSVHTRLQRLYMENIQIDDINSLKHHVRLRELELSDTEISDVSPLSNLRNLKKLNLSNTQIGDLRPLSNLTQLQSLYLNNAKIGNLDFLNTLLKLKYLDVSNNHITVFPEFLLQLNQPTKESDDYSSGILIGNNPWQHPPLEILLKGSGSIRAYFDSVKNQPLKPLNEVKVILVGEGAAGKTSLVRRLLSQIFNPRESQTHGILVNQNEFVCAEDRVQVHFWDFGGQEIMHATHQFFLTERSIYVLVLDSRKEDKTEYWLKHIEAFGKQSPVLVVINKVDENPGFDLNRPFLNEKYSNINNRFFRVSCKRGDGISEFQDALQTAIQDMDIRKQPFSPNWLAVKQTLSTVQRDYITYEEFQQHCEADSVTDEAQQKTLLGFLNDLGIVFEHKRQSDRFGTFIMNPQWLTRAVYRIINAPEVADKNGFLAWDDLEFILHKPEDTVADPDQRRKELKFSYPNSKFSFIVSMLQQFELCYKIENEERWMIPDLLPVSRKDIPIDFTGAAHYLFAYDFLPNSVLPTLMVQLSRWIVPDLQWRTGVVLKDLSSESYAYIEADKDAKSIAIRVKSQGASFQRSFLNLIRQTLQDINRKLNISIDEKVAVLDAPNEFVSYQDLIIAQELGEKQILIPKLRRKYIISDLLEGVDTTNHLFNSTRTQMTNIFISYSHKDATYKEDLMKSLKPLIRQGKIQLWQDGEIIAGQRWNDEIMGHLERAHVVITLMSPDFIDSEFCYSIELANASKAEARGGKTIIPVQIRPCGWQDLPIGAIQGIPVKPISAYRSHDTGWMEVYKRVKQALDRWQSTLNPGDY